MSVTSLQQCGFFDHGINKSSLGLRRNKSAANGGRIGILGIPDSNENNREFCKFAADSAIPHVQAPGWSALPHRLDHPADLAEYLPDLVLAHDQRRGKGNGVAGGADQAAPLLGSLFPRPLRPPSRP